ncbi:uncharacterized protein LOC110857797 [Folsomia candida]|uniref:Uncharacterized protein n=1 Tax=Folsomia candida TaxID=158441 RepID=A0A226DIW6_FOLCA|nr:uncharacterized protein LOC110857797 [Folsomia candida]OXA44627.1 hypothetical protein Fcan01_20634 [Folsomia candida]
MYKLAIVLSVAVVVALFAGASAGKLEGKKMKDGHHKHHNLTCKGEAINMKGMFVGKKECYDEIFGTSATTVNPKTMTEEAKKERIQKWKDNALCMEVCTMKKQKTLNADGTYNALEAEKWVKAIFPSAVQSALKKAFDDCASTNGKSFSMDNKCAGYKAFRQCKVKSVMEICEFKKGEVPEDN